MITHKKILTSLAVLGTLSSTAVFGANTDFSPVAEENNGWIPSVSVEAFYGAAMEKLWKEVDLDEVNIGGVNVRYSAIKETSSIVSPEIFGIFSLGGGSLDQTWDVYGSHLEINYDLLTGYVAGGANLRIQASDKISFFVGGRLGLSVGSLDVDYEENGYSESESDTAAGLLYGVGIGVQSNFNEHHGVTLGLDFIGSTAEFKFGDDEMELEMEKQSYIVFSVGYKYTF